MSQHCQRDMTNTPSRPMKLLGCPRVPRAVSNPPPDPWQAGRKSQELAVSIPGNVLGNIAEACVLCHVKKLGSMKSSWELFLSAVWSQVNKFWFPGTFCNVPRNFFKNSQERFLGIVFHVPRWPYSSRTVDGTCLSKKYELEIMNEYGV